MFLLIICVSSFENCLFFLPIHLLIRNIFVVCRIHLDNPGSPLCMKTPNLIILPNTFFFKKGIRIGCGPSSQWPPFSPLQISWVGVLNELSYRLPHQQGSTNVSVLPPRNLGGDLIAFFKTEFQPGELGFYRTPKQLPFIVSLLWAGNAHTLPELILPAVQLEARAPSWWGTQSVQSRAADNCSMSHMLPAGPMPSLPLTEVTSWTDIMIISFGLLEKYSLLGASKERARPYLAILISRLTHLRQGKDLGKKNLCFLLRLVCIFPRFKSHFGSSESG